MEQNFRIATDLGYLTYDPSRVLSKDRIKDHPDGKLVIATTGAQGEPMAGLAGWPTATTASSRSSRATP